MWTFLSGNISFPLRAQAAVSFLQWWESLKPFTSKIHWVNSSDTAVTRLSISQRKLVMKIDKSCSLAAWPCDVKLRRKCMPISQNEFNYMLICTHTYDTQTHTYTHIHTQALQHMCHIWSRAISLCFWGQSSWRPAGLGFDHCVQEVRFVEFGPAHCPSCAQLLTQTIVSWDRVIWSLEVHNQAH